MKAGRGQLDNARRERTVRPWKKGVVGVYLKGYFTVVVAPI